MGCFRTLQTVAAAACMLFLISAANSANEEVTSESGRRGGLGGGKGSSMVPGMFVFGDSLIDNGNNNGLATFARANYYPYGIDFQSGPTGRFCNGLTIVDAISNLVGLPFIPAHSEATGDDDGIMYGLNYASAASGILDETGRNFIGRIPFNQQIKNFVSTLDQITGRLGADDVAAKISNCLFFVGMGSNDYLNNYLLPNFNTKDKYTGDEFSDLLVGMFDQQLTRLYNLGGRKFVLSGVGSLGCIPSVLAKTPDGQCDKEIDKTLIVPYNNKVKKLTNKLNSNLPGSKFIYIDIFHMFMHIRANSKSYGFDNVDTGCCGVGRNRGEMTCLPFETPCEDRDRYVFWDAFHPTEAMNVLMAKIAFNGNKDFIFPMNIHQLATIDLRDSNN